MGVFETVSPLQLSHVAANFRASEHNALWLTMAESAVGRSQNFTPELLHDVFALNSAIHAARGVHRHCPPARPVRAVADDGLARLALRGGERCSDRFTPAFEVGRPDRFALGVHRHSLIECPVKPDGVRCLHDRKSGPRRIDQALHLPKCAADPFAAGLRALRRSDPARRSVRVGANTARGNAMRPLLIVFACALAGGPHCGHAAINPPLANPILFVTQVPTGYDFVNMTISAPFANHLPTTLAAPRGGDLMLMSTTGTLRYLTQEAGYGSVGGGALLTGNQAIAVRDPAIFWDASKAIFSMRTRSRR